jgi:RNA polymerase sigma factor (sigma-70 family)
MHKGIGQIQIHSKGAVELNFLLRTRCAGKVDECENLASKGGATQTVAPEFSKQSRWFAEHLQPHEAMLRAWLQSRFPQLNDFDDIIQEAYARVLAAHSKQELIAPKAFFFATARNLAFDHFRRLQIAQTSPLGGSDDLSVLDEGPSAPESLDRAQKIELMTQAVQSLPDRCRQVLTLRNIYGLTHKEIAKELGISVRTVEAQAAIGLRRCIDFVAKKGRA